MASNSKKNDKKVIIILGIIVLILVAATIITNYLSKIPDNPPTLTGNSAGNLNNGGYFCEDDGVIYFSNSFDGGSIYSMNPDQTNLKKLYSSHGMYINSAGDYLYFGMSSGDGGTGLGYVLKTTGVYRMKKNGSNVKALSNDASLIIALSGNNLFYQAGVKNGVGLKKLDITQDKQTPVIVEDTFVLNPSCIVDGTVYFGGTQKDHYLYSLNTTTNNITSIWGGDIWNPVYDGGYFYYMDISDNYSLCRYNPQAQTVDVLTHDRLDNFNVGYGYVYYSTSVSNNPGLYRMHTDGSMVEQIASGYICDINMTSTYTYFREYNVDETTYCVPTSGAPSVGIFNAAKEAASKNN